MELNWPATTPSIAAYRVGTQCHLLDIDVEYRPWREWKEGLKLQEENSGNAKFLA